MVSCSDVARLGGRWPSSPPEAVSPAADPDGPIPTESAAWSPNDATAGSGAAADGIPIARPSLATPSDPPFRQGAPLGSGGNDAREPLAVLAPRTQSAPTLPPRARAGGDTYATPPPPPPRVGLMLLWVPALAARTGLRLHPRSSPGREGLRLRQVGHGGRSAAAAPAAAAATAADGVPYACVPGTGGGSPPVDRRVRETPPGRGKMDGMSARLYGVEEEERARPLPRPPLLPLPPIVSRRPRRLPVLLLYPERGLTLPTEARPSLRDVGLGLPGSDSGDFGA